MKRMRGLTAVFLLLLTLAGFFPCAQAEEYRDKQLLTYYQDALFIGDSITQQFRNFIYKKKKNEPGFRFDGKFFASQSYTLYSASRNVIPSRGTALTFNGQPATMYDILERRKPGKLLILLGVNDYVGEQIEKSIGYCRRIIDQTARYSPDTQVIFFSLTPVTRDFCRKKDYRILWDEYNEALRKLCGEKGAGYLDIATFLKDEQGYLPAAYSSDGKYHLSDKGLTIWLERLVDYAREQAEAGKWTPEEDAQ